MNKLTDVEKVKVALGGIILSNGDIKSVDDDYIDYCAGSSVITLDGGFDADDLEAMVIHMRNTQAMAHPMRNLPVRACSIRCKGNPEWGTFGVFEDHGDHYAIGNRGGQRVLSKDEAVQYWERMPSN